MMCSLAVSGLVLIFTLGASASPGRPPLLDGVQEARKLFHVALQQHSNGMFLTLQQIQYMFSIFDQDHDGRVSNTEFSKVWTTKGLGGSASANFLFHRADTDRSGFISNAPDLVRVFDYFDRDGDRKVNEPEFIVTWASLTH